jgi:peptidyl-prolyl cis-trans isomerase B (cyclophilin B)
MMKRIAAAVLFLAVTAPAWAETEGVALQQIDTFIEESKIDTTKDSWRTSLPKPNVVMFEKGADYVAVMETNKGTIRIKLLSLTAPMHATSFIYLTRLGFYDGLSFHRVITGFMAQGGCPLGTGTGGPGYKYDGEYDPDVKHDRPGLLSMANAGPGTDGSQFFLTFVPTPHLNGKHTIFGEVTDGMDVVKTLEASGSSSGRPSEKLVMTKVTIEVE